MLWHRHHLWARKLRRWYQLWKHIQLWKHHRLLQRLCRRLLQPRQSTLRQPPLQQRLQPKSTLQPTHQQPTLEPSELLQSLLQQPALEQPKNQQHQNRYPHQVWLLILLNNSQSTHFKKGGLAPLLLALSTQNSPPHSHIYLHLWQGETDTPKPAPQQHTSRNSAGNLPTTTPVIDLTNR